MGRRKKAVTKEPDYPGADLFGQAAVSWEDVFRWIEAVNGLSRHSPRAPNFIKSFEICEKVAWKKLIGEYDETIERKERDRGILQACDSPWIERFAWIMKPGQVARF